MKMVRVNSQRAIEQAVADGRTQGTEMFPVTVTLEVSGPKLNATFDGEIKLQ